MRQASRRIPCGRKKVINVVDVLPHKEPGGSVMHQGKVLQESKPQFTGSRARCANRCLAAIARAPRSALSGGDLSNVLFSSVTSEERVPTIHTGWDKQLFWSGRWQNIPDFTESWTPDIHVTATTLLTELYWNCSDVHEKLSRTSERRGQQETKVLGLWQLHVEACSFVSDNNTVLWRVVLLTFRAKGPALILCTVMTSVG